MDSLANKKTSNRRRNPSYSRDLEIPSPKRQRANPSNSSSSSSSSSSTPSSTVINPSLNPTITPSSLSKSPSFSPLSASQSNQPNQINNQAPLDNQNTFAPSTHPTTTTMRLETHTHSASSATLVADHASFSSNNTNLTKDPTTKDSNGTLPHTAFTAKKKSSKSSLNGSSPEINGTTYDNNIATNTTPPSSYFGHNTTEVTRLILQSLYDLGYNDVAALLQKNSGLSTELPVVSSFRTAILLGHWDEAESLLPSLKIRPKTDITYLSFLIRRQQFLELLESQDKEGALKILRTKLSTVPRYLIKSKTETSTTDDDNTNENKHVPTPEELQARRVQIAELSTLVMYSAQDITKTLSRDGARNHSRYYLLHALQELISPDMMIPRHRLARLLTQAQEFQLSRANYRISNPPFSLILDYPDDRSQFPTQTIKKLTNHTDEVWFLNFSHNGKYLASGSKDCTVIVWRVSDWSIQSKFTGHKRGVVGIEWSPNDQMILTASQDRHACVFDPLTGDSILDLNVHHDVVSACAWLPNSRYFFTASPDMMIYMWDLQGTQIDCWTCSRILAMSVTPNGKLLIAIDHNDTISFYNVAAKRRIAMFKIDKMLSVTVSKDSRYALVNMESQEIHLWDLVSLRIVKKYNAQTEQLCNSMGQPVSFVLRSCFGGPEENLVLCGDQNGNINIWNRETTNLIEVFSGHKGSVNCVRFNPQISNMFVSCGDDETIRIWGP